MPLKWSAPGRIRTRARAAVLAGAELTYHVALLQVSTYECESARFVISGDDNECLPILFAQLRTAPTVLSSSVSCISRSRSPKVSIVIELRALIIRKKPSSSFCAKWFSAKRMPGRGSRHAPWAGGKSTSATAANTFPEVICRSPMEVGV